MQGSEKQVKWANDIKVKAVADLQRWFDSNRSRSDAAGEGDNLRKVAARVMELVEAQTDAKWWIEQVNGKPSVGKSGWAGPLYQQALKDLGLA